MQMISGKLKHLFHTLPALKVKVLLKVRFSYTRNVDMATSCSGLPASQLTLHVLLLSSIGRLYFGALGNKLVCFSLIIHTDMNYKRENEKYGISMRDLSFPFIKKYLMRPQRTRKVA